jgi:F-type H+-transporting ATPase subunit delta
MLIVSLVLLQIVIFGGLIFVLRRVLNQNVILATKHLDELNQDYSKKEQDIQKRLEDLKQKTQEILSNAQGEAQQLKESVIKQAEKEKDDILSKARAKGEDMMKQADKSRQILISEIDDRIAKEAVNKACELTQYVLPEEFKQIVHTHWLNELIKNGFDQLERLSVAEDIHEINVRSAFDLNEEQRRLLSKKMKEVLSRDIALKETVDSNMVAGVIITIGSLVLDGSFKNKIQEQAKKLSL